MSNPLVIAGMQAVGTIARANAAAKPHKMQAELLRRQAERAAQVEAANADRVRRQRARENAHLRARLLASGVDTASGSALLTLESRAGDAEFEKLNRINEGLYQSEILNRRAGLASHRGRQLKRDAFRKATATVLLAK